MTISTLVRRITFLSVFAMASRVSMDTDTWWHLRAGEWILTHRAIPLTDPFSYTRFGQPWNYPGWLVQAPMAWVYRWLGPGGLNLWVAGMVTLAFIFIWQTLSGGAFLKAFVVVLAAAASGVYWAARPYMVTFVLAAAFLWILEDFHHRRKNRVWWLPILMVLWVNSHGGFAVGFILWGVYFADRVRVEIGRFKTAGWRISAFHLQSETIHLFFIGVAMLAAVVVNPSGVVMLLYPFKTVEIKALQDFIQEWQSPNFHTLQVQPCVWLLLVTLGAVGASRKGLTFVEFALVSGFAYLGLLAGRNVALFGLVAPLVLTRHAGPVLESWAQSLGVRTTLISRSKPSRLQADLNRIILGVLILVTVIKPLSVYDRDFNLSTLDRSLPTGAVEYLRKTRPEGRLFNSYNWGSYLLWALPEYPVFVDGRTDLYDDEIIGQWFQVVRAEAGWQDVLDNWGVHTILLEKEYPVVGKLAGEGWALLFEDDLSVVYGRLP